MRTQSRAIIINNNKILLVKKKDIPEFFLLPGGGQRFGETLEQTLKRECLEETGFEVNINGLKFIREYIGVNHEFKDKHSDRHSIDFIFYCEVEKPLRRKKCINPDENQLGSEWIEIERIFEINFYPKILKKYISIDISERQTTFLGDVN